MDESSVTQNRRSRRAQLLMAASLEHDGAITSVKLRNLSAEGALVEGDLRLKPGVELLFRKNDLTACAHCAWVEGRRAGITFRMKLDPEIVLRHVPSPKARRDEAYKRPGFHGRLSDQERRFGETVWDRPLPSVEK